MTRRQVERAWYGRISQPKVILSHLSMECKGFYGIFTLFCINFRAKSPFFQVKETPACQMLFPNIGRAAPFLKPGIFSFFTPAIL